MYVEVCKLSDVCNVCMLKSVSYQMYVMYVCWSMCMLSDVCNACMLKSVSYQMYVMYVCWSL